MKTYDELIAEAERVASDDTGRFGRESYYPVLAGAMRAAIAELVRERDQLASDLAYWNETADHLRRELADVQAGACR